MPCVCAHVVVAEDDPRQAEVVRQYLTAAGYETTLVRDGISALEVTRRLAPDLLVLDLMMPRLDGLTVCRTLRGESDLAILVLTARSTENDLLTGLDTGADDYLTKPYSPRELTARVRTLLRRTQVRATPAPPERVYRIRDLTVTPDRHLVTIGDRPVECTPGEFAILAALTARPGRVFTRAQLLVHTRGLDRSSTERTIDVHVMNLRRKIEADARRPQYLQTVFGVGYRISE
jgi:two-component system response regulator MtrA